MVKTIVRGPEPMLPHALRLHRLGISVIPINAGRKTPALKKWKRFQSQRPTDSELHDWFADVDNMALGLGAVLGEVSGGLLVRDYDKIKGFDALVTSREKIVRSLPTVRTGRG